MAKLDTYSLDGFPDWEDYDDIMEGFAAQDAAFAKLQEKSDALPEGKLVGHIMWWGRGDGRAYYMVTKERPLTLTWIPYGDRYSVEDALIRGLTKADVTLHQQRSKLPSLFGPSTRTDLRTRPGQ